MTKKTTSKKPKKLKQPFDDMMGLQLWPSSKIRYAYLEDNYALGESGHLGGSCMRYREMQKALNFYVKNGVKILVQTDENNKILSRALWWDDIVYGYNGSSKKITYVDRCYFAQERHHNKYKNFVTAYNLHNYSQAGIETHRDYLYKLNINLTGISHLPYADTFIKLAFKDKILYRKYTGNNIKHSSYITSLTTTHAHGYHRELDKNAVREVLTGTWCSKKDCIYVKRYEGHVLKENIVDINGTYYHNNDDILTRLSNNEFCLKTDVVIDQLTKNRIDKNKALFMKKYNSYIPNTDIVAINNENYSKHDKEVAYYKGTNTYYLKKQCYKSKHTDENMQPIYIPKDRAIIIYDLNKIPSRDKTGHIIRHDDGTPKLEVRFLCYSGNKVCNECRYYKTLNTGCRCTAGTPTFNRELFVEKDYTNYIEIDDGSFIIDTTETRQYLKKWNKKYHIKHEFKLPDKKQLLLFK